MINNEFDIKLFIRISNYVKKIIIKNIMKNINLCYDSTSFYNIYNNLNLCNNTEDELFFLTKIINIVKENNSTSSNEKIYLVVIYLYYGLVLEEHPNNYLMIYDIKNIISNPTNKIEIYDDIINLIFEISSSEKEYCSKIRKIFFNL